MYITPYYIILYIRFLHRSSLLAQLVCIVVPGTTIKTDKLCKPPPIINTMLDTFEMSKIHKCDKYICLMLYILYYILLIRHRKALAYHRLFVCWSDQ